MIVVANLRLSGFFRVITQWIARHVKRPIVLLVAVILASGILSAFLVNDTICLVMTPLVLELVTKLKRNPIPYLLATATASNIGSVATVTGNPQNIVIGSLSHISYGDFALELMPIAFVGLMACAVLIALSYRTEFFTHDHFETISVSTRYHGPLLAKSIVVLAIIVVLFIIGQPVAKVAIVGGAFLLLTRRVKPEKVYIVFQYEGYEYGILGCAVGAAFAVLITEELFASGCQLVVSMTSAGQILPVQAPPYFVVIDRALRDEGTSYHYLPPSNYSLADPKLARCAQDVLAAAGIPFHVGATWTTDAPFRETQEAIDAALHTGILAVEMEAAALYAFAKARRRQVLCLAHVTNQMGRVEGDFEKGVADGAEASLRVISLTASRWRTGAPS
jgi:purine-nucleoside phosphorylase